MQPLGNYLPLLQLATGGMATIYVARHSGAAGFERLVVLKRVHPHLVKDRAFSDMFRDEARVASTIRHPNVVPVIDVVESSGELFLVLDYVESVSLSALSKLAVAEGELPAPIVVRIVVDALAGLHAAHEATDMRGQKVEIIHRDVSPQNIIVGADGTSRLIDFGIAKAASRVTETSSGVLKGKLHYLSPEQLRQRPIDRRADIFAAGVVLYEAITGKRLFDGDEAAVMMGILMGEIDPPSSVHARAPAALDDVISKALARDRDDRFQTAAEFQEALERAMTPASPREVAKLVEQLAGDTLRTRRAELHKAVESGTSLVAPAAATITSSSVEAVTVSEGSPSRRRARTKPLVWTGLALGAAAIAGIAAFSLRTRGRADPAAPAVSTDPSTHAETSAFAPAASTAPPSLSASVASSGAAQPPASASVAPPSVGVPPSHRAPARRASDLHRGNPYGE